MCVTETINITCFVCGTVTNTQQVNVICRDAQRKRRGFGQCTRGRQPDEPKQIPNECEACQRKRLDKEDRTTMEESKQKTLRDLWNNRDDDDDGYYGW